MTYQTPCQNPENDPDDWFIGKDGKQYADESFLTEEEAIGIISEIDDDVEDFDAVATLAIERVQSQRKREALIARRKARAACYDCYFRLQCLDIALGNVETHGTWGGYYEEELRQIRHMREQRRNANG